MSFEETDAEESATSLSEVSTFDDDFDEMHLESESSDEEMAGVGIGLTLREDTHTL